MIFAIKPFEIHDGDGIRTTVFFKGCSLRCKWCHNPESFSAHTDVFFDAALCRDCLKCTSVCGANKEVEGKHIFLRDSCDSCGKCEGVCPQKALEAVGTDMGAEEIALEALRDEIFMRESGGGVTFSGGEPLLQADLCVQIAKLLKARDIHLAIDTCLAVPRAAIDKILPFADAFLIDIKAIDEATHIACTGVSNKTILDNILYIDSKGVPIEIRYPYVPTMNDSEAERIAAFIKDLKHVTCVRVLPYHNYAERKYESLGISYPLPDVPVPTKEDIAAVAAKMTALGVKNIALY